MVPTMARIERYSASTAPMLAAQVGGMLGASGLIALPTESFYGLAVAPFDEQALVKIVAGQGPVGGETDSPADRGTVSARRSSFGISRQRLPY